MTFDYVADGFDIDPAIRQAHQQSWSSIANAGSFFTGKQRVAIALLARAARLQRHQPSWQRQGLRATAQLDEVVVTATNTIAADAYKIDRAWAEKVIGVIGDTAYVELGAIVATVSAIDAFNEALGRDHEPLPQPQIGQPNAERKQGVVEVGAYVPMLDPWPGPNVSRALSLLPSANQLFMSNVMVMYTRDGNGFDDMIWPGPLSRPQIELLAARVSSSNECFY